MGREVEWQVAMRPGKRRKLDPGSEEALAEKRKASVRAKVEHPFLKVKRVFGYAKVKCLGGARFGPFSPRCTPGATPRGTPSKNWSLRSLSKK